MIIDSQMNIYKAKYKTVNLKEWICRFCLQIYQQAEARYLRSSAYLLLNRKQYHDGVLSVALSRQTVVSHLCCVP